MESEYCQRTYRAESGTSEELYDVLSGVRDPDFCHIMGYGGVSSSGKVYHLNGCTVKLTKGARSLPVSIFGNSKLIDKAVSKLEKLAGVGLKKMF